MSMITYVESNFGPVRETKTCRIPRNTFITNSFKKYTPLRKKYERDSQFSDSFDLVVHARGTKELF